MALPCLQYPQAIFYSSFPSIPLPISLVPSLSLYFSTPYNSLPRIRIHLNIMPSLSNIILACAVIGFGAAAPAPAPYTECSSGYQWYTCAKTILQGAALSIHATWTLVPTFHRPQPRLSPQQCRPLLHPPRAAQTTAASGITEQTSGQFGATNPNVTFPDPAYSISLKATTVSTK